MTFMNNENEDMDWKQSPLYVRKSQHEILNETHPILQAPHHDSVLLPLVRFLRGTNKTRHTLSHSPPPPLLISHSCLLIPMFFAAWWYYTKKCFRKVSGLLRHCPEPQDVTTEQAFHQKFFRFDDAYIKWYVQYNILECQKKGMVIGQRKIP